MTDREAGPFLLREGDLIFCRSCGSLKLVGMTAVVDAPVENLVYPDTLIRVRLKGQILPEYVALVMQSDFGRSQIEKCARTDVGMYKIGTDDIRNFRIPLPPKRLQMKFVKDVRAARLQAARLSEQAAELRSRAVEVFEAGLFHNWSK